MSYLHSDLIFSSLLVRVFDVACHAPKSGNTSEEWCRTTQIIVPRRGVFLLHHQGTPIVADPNTAVVFGMGDTYHVSHPVDGGDQCTVLVFSQELLEDGLGNVKTQHGTIHPATQLQIHALTHRVANGILDQLEAEESAVFVLNSLASDFRSSSLLNGQQVSMFQKRLVEEVRALLASQPTDIWRLETIARTVYCSPFHLARQFRAVTGETIAHYLLRLRLVLALDYLAQGKTDVARLAVELGFAHHSHFSARFRSVFGMTPSAVRNTLTYRHLQQMSKIVTAKPRTGS